MDVLRPDDLGSLIGAGDGPCVSIYLPTHRAGREIRQDPRRLKNALRSARSVLEASGVRRRDARALLAPGDELIADAVFWQHQSDGLAVFLREGSMRTFRLPIRFGELVSVGRRFHVKPLLSYLGVDGHFFVLALSQNEVRLLEGSRDAVELLELPGVPQGLRHALEHEEAEPSLNLHVTSASGSTPAIFHGHGDGADDDKARILRYFREVDRGVGEVLEGERAPIVLAGVEYLFPIYAQANTYPEVVEGGIAGNPESLRPEELHARAWQLLEPRFRKRLEADADRCREMAGTGLGSTDLGEVLRAATEGRVETLFVAADLERWGRLDDGGVPILDEGPRNGNEDLLDRAAIDALRTGARVHVVPGMEVPEGAPIAAVFRF
jgi:hypothetical protein